ncbi:MAG: hypothetical protein KAT16_05260 [Candidatus Heimdallarchaeota archaeon]|nr:hypothetical protein [Candidatus Heimdallarchaeota archaeon]
MGKNEQIYTLVWDDGFLLKNDEKPIQNKIFLYIDKESKYMRLTYPSSIDFLTRRNLERQLRQIQKRGFFIEKLKIRIGQDFEYQMEEDREASPSTPQIKSQEKSQESTENENLIKLGQLISEIKRIWIHKRKGEGSDMTDSLKDGQPSYFVSYLDSDFQRLNILISSLPDKI